MATWSELKRYITENYDVARDLGGGLLLRLERAGSGRTQTVLVKHLASEDGTDDLVTISSPVGVLGEVDLLRALHAAAELACGGLNLDQGNVVTVCHTIFLANLDARLLATPDANEFDQPVMMVALGADDLEKALIGRDRF